MIDNRTLHAAITAAQEIFSQQTADDLHVITEHLGKAYNESTIVAEIAVKLILRVAKIRTEGDARLISPVDALVFDAEELFTSRRLDHGNL